MGMPDMVDVPAGEFWMGCNQDVDSECDADEKPGRKVYLNAFAIDRTEVTEGAYAACVSAGKCRASGAGLAPGRELHPVAEVSWDDATAFCAWAGGRLPCEIEWEYACRAWTETKYWFGDSEDQLEEYGWYRKNSGGQSHPVGAKPANPWGLHDMHGNVWEWCEDWFEPQAYRVRVERALIEEGEWEPDDLSGLSPQRLAEMVRKLVFPMTVVSARSWTRVLRGGSWFFSADACRSACRDHCKPRDVSSRIGFRVCRGGESVVARRPRD